METTLSNATQNSVLVVGATSSLAQAACRVLAERGYALVLAGRNLHELELLAADLSVRYKAPCRIVPADLADAHFSAADLIGQAGHFSHLIITAGDMGNGDNSDIHNIAYTTHLNYTVPAQIAAEGARHLSAVSSGTVVIVSSVAGDRGRASNYAYGSAKAALTTFASGLRNDFWKRGVHVMTVKPGFTDTPMTWGMKSPLMASREAVATTIINAMERKQDVMYAPWFWRFIMLIIRHIPESIFKKMQL